jgi:hypothetical protein
MKSLRTRFNTYLILGAVLLGGGCKSAEEKKRDKTLATIRLHLEVPPDTPQTPQNLQQVLGRIEFAEFAGFKMPVSSISFLDEAYVDKASVVDTQDGGFAMLVEFGAHGKLVIDSVTTANPNRHIAILTTFGEEKSGKRRWLGAPLINAPINDGVLLFTSNTTRAEADEIVLGLNNVVKQRKKQSALFDLGTGK